MTDISAIGPKELGKHLFVTYTGEPLRTVESVQVFTNVGKKCREPWGTFAKCKFAS